MNRAMTCTIFLLASSAAMVACTTKSLHAGYTNESQVAEPAVVGTWTNEEGRATLVVTRADDAYDVLLRIDADDGEDQTVVLRSVLFRAGGGLFVDASLSDDAWEHIGIANAFALRTHALARVVLAGDSLTIREVKPGALDDLLRKDESALDHVHMNNDEVVLNAPSKRLMEVLGQHAADDAFFNDADAAHRFKRVPVPKESPVHPSVKRS